MNKIIIEIVAIDNVQCFTNYIDSTISFEGAWLAASARRRLCTGWPPRWNTTESYCQGRPLHLTGNAWAASTLW